MHDLMEEIVATAPQPRPAFVAELERRVEAGFPKEQRRIKLPPLRPVLAFATISLAAMVVSIALLTQHDSDDAMPVSGTVNALKPAPAADSAGSGAAGTAREATP